MSQHPGTSRARAWQNAVARRTYAVAACVSLVSCSKPHAPTPADAAPAPSAAAPAPAQQALSDKSNRAIAEADLRALLERWLAAQNQRDLTAYEALYASKFLGIKRAGDRTTQFTREAWLKDRQRMLEKPLKVEVSGLLVRPAAHSAELRFTQRWASETFEDVGPKRLLVVREGGALKIAHEEMLHSELVAPNRAAEIDFHFTLTLESGLYMMLPEAKLPAEHGALKAEAESGGNANDAIYTTSAQVDDAQLDASVRPWKGTKVRLDDGCIAEVRGFVLLSRVEPHFGTLQEWQGSEDPPQPALSAEQRTQAAFALTQPVLAAQLDGCKPATFAQRAQTPPPVMGTAIDDQALLQKGRAAFAKLPAVVALQRRHLTEAEDPSGLWWSESIQVQGFRHPGSGQTLVSVHADNGGVCGEFSAAEWAIFELKRGTLTRIYSADPPGSIRAALDLDADGRLELIVTHRGFDTDAALISPDADGPHAVLTHSYQDCGC